MESCMSLPIYLAKTEPRHLTHASYASQGNNDHLPLVDES